MAGIGFELKKLYKSNSILFKFRAILYTSVAITGPQVLCIAAIASLQLIVSLMNVSFSQRELFLASTLYSFIFSQIITSGFSMLVTRYISDKLYSKEYDKIMPSLYGVLSICITIGAVAGIIFFYRSPLHFSIKFITYILFMELIIMWLETVYLGTIKEYFKIVKTFFLGLVTSVVLGIVILMSTKLNPIEVLLASLDVGTFVIITLLMLSIQNFFKSSDRKYFEFLKYFDKYSILFFICFFYTLSMYIHNFIFWSGSLGKIVAGTYIFAPSYDVPTFYALLTILPSMVIFAISLETSFYDRYREYYSQITCGGNLRDIVRARKSMVLVLWQEMFHLMEVQFFFTFVCILIGNCFLPFIGLTQTSIDIFDILTFGAYCSISMFIIVLIGLYFENRKGAFVITSIFLVSNFLFTIISVKLGYGYYGLGYFLASFISLCAALHNLTYFLNDIDYITFCSQPVIYREKTGIFTRMVDKFYK
ncbi:exopolysaccharide Pel transporter PelG [Clostridium sp. MT-14]|uniref:exopolysaccharide Pel transporter PelG n=1 Tax=Clostridium sp. MT-14 TaxID=3348360 RepID=UPI0035F2DE22